MNPQSPSQSNYPSNLPPDYQSSPGQPSTPAINNPLSVMQPGEQVICEIKRHPIGLIGVYAMSGLLVVGLAVAVFGFAPQYLTSVTSSQIYEVGGLLFIIVALLAFGFVAIANKVYWGNRWILTSDSVTQITQSSLFDKQTSQLSLGNLEDVTVDQNGLLQHMYNFGVLHCETAGERSKFVFMFCPDPTNYARQILDARERFEQGRQDGQRLYRDQGTYPQQSAPAATPYPPQYGQPTPPQPGQPGPYNGPNPQTNPMPPTYGGEPDHGVNVNIS